MIYDRDFLSFNVINSITFYSFKKILNIISIFYWLLKDKIMKLILYCLFENGVNMDCSDILTFDFDVDHLEEMETLIINCKKTQEEESFVEIFQKMYDRTSDFKGFFYDAIFGKLSNYGWYRLGWHDVMIRVVGLKINDEYILNPDTLQDKDWYVDRWAIQLVREDDGGYMYCCYSGY
jgi:hypothetical protein